MYTSGGNMSVDGNDTTNYTLTDLEENTPYNITVRAVSDNRTSGDSNQVSVTTFSAGK